MNGLPFAPVPGVGEGFSGLQFPFLDIDFQEFFFGIRKTPYDPETELPIPYLINGSDVEATYQTTESRGLLFFVVGLVLLLLISKRL